MVTKQDARMAEIERIDAGLNLDGSEDVQQLNSNSSAYVTLVSMETGLPRPVLRLDYKRVLGKLRGDGTPAFWMEGMGGPQPPEPLPTPVKCFLDPGFDEIKGPLEVGREYIDRIGLVGRTCNLRSPDKHNATFASVWDRNDHAETKHPREWKTLQEALARDQAERDRQEAREMREAMLAMAGSGPVFPPGVTAEEFPRIVGGGPTTADPQRNIDVQAPLEKFPCPVCGESKATPKGAATHLRMSQDAEHSAFREMQQTASEVTDGVDPK